MTSSIHFIDMTVCKMINFQNKQEDIYGNLEAYYTPASNEDEIYSQLKSCGTNNIPHVQIRLALHAPYTHPTHTTLLV